jgi:hypothetical protein
MQKLPLEFLYLDFDCSEMGGCCCIERCKVADITREGLNLTDTGILCLFFSLVILIDLGSVRVKLHVESNNRII